MRNDKENIVVKLSFEFALKIIEFTELLKKEHKYELARQLFKSGTSIGANINEAQNAESTKDFIHKFKIAGKEADETKYWIRLCQFSEFFPNPDKELIQDLESLIKIISKIISTSKKKELSN